MEEQEKQEKQENEFDTEEFIKRFMTSLAEQYAHQCNAKIVEGSLKIEPKKKDGTA